MSSLFSTRPALPASDAAWRAYDNAWAVLTGDDAGARRLLAEADAGFASAGDVHGAAAVAASGLLLIASRHIDYRGLDAWLERFVGSAVPDAASRPLLLRHHSAQLCLSSLDRDFALDARLVQDSAAAVFDILRAAPALPADERLMHAKLLLDHLTRNKEVERFESVASLLASALDDPAASPDWIGIWWWRLATSYAQFGEKEAGAECRERAWQLARRHGLADLEFSLLAEDLSALCLAGDLAPAGDIVARMKALAPVVNAAWRGHGLTYIARYHLLRQEPIVAKELCARAMALYAGIEIADRQVNLPRSTLAFAHVLLHEEETALDLLRTCLAHQSGGQAAVIRSNLHSIEAYRALRSGAADAGERLDRALAQAQSIRQLSVLNLLPQQAAVLFDAALARGLHGDFVTRAIRLRKLAPPDPVQQRWPWALRLRAFGGFSIERDGIRVGATGKAQKKPVDLLKAVLVAGGDADVDSLVEQVWPSLEAKDPRASFDMALSRLRKLIGVDGALVLADGRLSLDRRLVWWDLAEFEAVRLRLHAALATMSEAAVVVGLVERLAGLCVGPLFGGEAASIASLAARERLSMAWQRVVHDAGEWLESRSLWAAAIALYERGLAQQMLAESLYRGLMRCHLALDERAEAALAYRRCRDLMLRVLGISPSAETQRLFEQVRADQGLNERAPGLTPPTVLPTGRKHFMNTADLIAIDTHTHLEVSCRNPFDNYGEEYDRAADKYFRSSKRPTMQETIDFYRAMKIGFVNFTVDAESQMGRRRIPNEEIAEAAQANPDIMIAFGSIDPHKGKMGGREARKLVEEYGVRGFKFHPTVQGFEPADKMAWPIYEVIAEHKLPAIFHSGHSGIGSGMRCGGGLRLQNSNPMLVEDVAMAFPDMQIVLAHPSWPWQDEAISLAMHKPNVWIDLSGWSPKYFPPQLVQYANTLLKDRILFGSDFPLITPDRWLKDFEDAGFKDAVKPLILKQNAMRLLGLT